MAEASRPAPALEAARVPAGGSVGWVRNAMARARRVEFRESFRDDAKSWQNAANGLPAGWAHYPQGYVKTGPMALFRPSLGFTDYRFEFFGQIEAKSMGWVVRAQDRKNYYATKVKVVKPGLRPIIAIEHYAVVAGKPGHRVEIPLNVMVHNDMPYHVAVVVRGHYLITSIEDQEVDTWTDESLAAGGVGFFSEAGESARLYWMRLTKNQDIWGRVAPTFRTVPRASPRPRRCGLARRRCCPNGGFRRPQVVAPRGAGKDGSMEVLIPAEPKKTALPPGVTPIDEVKNRKRTARMISKAASLKMEGKIEAAVQMLGKWIESGERDAALYSALGHLQYEMRDYEAAAATYAQLAEREPSHRTARFNLGVCQGNLKNWKAAVESFRKAAEADSTRSDVQLGLGISLIHNGSPAQALVLSTSTWRFSPNTSRLFSGRLWPCSRSGGTPRRSSSIARFWRRNPRSEEALANLVALFLERKDLESVRHYVAMLAELKPESAVALEALSALAFVDGDYPTAARYCRTLTEIAPGRFENWFNLGVAHQKLGNHRKAAQAYQQATTLKPDSAQAHLNLGVTWQELSDLPAARLCYEKALETDPRQPGVLWNLALVLEQLGERERAEKLYSQVPEAAPEWCDAVFRLGYLQLVRGEYVAAAGIFEKCLAKRLDWPEAFLNAGIAHVRSGNPERARQLFQEALLMRPDSSDALRGLAALALEDRNYEEAYDLHRRLIDLGDHSPELFYNAGLICQKNGNMQDATRFYQRALVEDPLFAEALLNLGHALMTMGQEEEAQAYWRKAIREKPDLAQQYFDPARRHNNPQLSVRNPPHALPPNEAGSARGP